MFKKITEWFYKRYQKQLQIDLNSKYVHENEKPFLSVLNTINAGKIVVATFPDGIYIRMAGNESKGQVFSKEFVKVLSTEEKKTEEK